MFRQFLPCVALAVLVTAQSPLAGAQAPRSAPAAKPAASASAPVNINSAGVADLQALPGVGAKTAARIVEYRQKNGPFKKIEELMNVRGVGEKNFLKLKSQITVAGLKAELQER